MIKTCVKCKTNRDIEWFHNDKRRTDGHFPYCKFCRTNGKNKYISFRPFNESFFEQWSSELAWLVGLIWSDGCLKKNTISITSKDKDLLDQVVQLIQQQDGVRPHTNNAYHISFSSRKVSNWFRSIGLIERKSLTVQWPIIPDELIPHFIRGVFDGDGYVCTPKMRTGQQVPDLYAGFCSASPDFLMALHIWLMEHGIKHGSPNFVREQKNPTRKIVIYNQGSLRKLFYLMYPLENVPKLDRKYIKFKQWMNTERAPVGPAVRCNQEKGRKIVDYRGVRIYD